MKNILIIILSAAAGAVIMHYFLSALGFNFDRGMVFGVSGAIIGGWVSSYLNKKETRG